MTSEEYQFTSTEEMNNFEDGDTAMDLTGYVDAIEGMKVLKTHQKRVFKFLLNNGAGKRMKVLLWAGDVLKYQSQVTMYQVVELTMGKIRDMNLKLPLPRGKDYVLTEYHFQPASTLTCIGVYKKDDYYQDYEEVSLGEIMSKTTRICTEVYLRTAFKSVTTATEVQAMGLTIDKQFKLSVGIVSFSPNPENKQGVCVKIRGILEKNKMRGVFLKVDDMSCIEIVDAKTMTVSEMKNVAISATSKRRSEGSLPLSKRSKENESPNKGKME
ncbi:uncharacterized protein LOC135169087 [Diachasmimorpha longicaudata]|uniref:uncharacterized protein LOC135169087 n=1 Tax=Diachasmimorpha longicaudata TaxID=58733 RepID=UPI0030B8915A